MEVQEISPSNNGHAIQQLDFAPGEIVQPNGRPDPAEFIPPERRVPEPAGPSDPPMTLAERAADGREMNRALRRVTGGGYSDQDKGAPHKQGFCPVDQHVIAFMGDQYSVFIAEDAIRVVKALQWVGEQYPVQSRMEVPGEAIEALSNCGLEYWIKITNFARDAKLTPPTATLLGEPHTFELGTDTWSVVLNSRFNDCLVALHVAGIGVTSTGLQQN